VLIGGRDSEDARALAAVLRSVVDARNARYVMLNVPQARLDRVVALLPASRSPSVLPLAEPGMVAVHALVPADDVWQLVPALQEEGASSILVVPVERMAS
jgi:ATP phosphoribosyltransferase